MGNSLDYFKQHCWPTLHFLKNNYYEFCDCFFVCEVLSELARILQKQILVAYYLTYYLAATDVLIIEACS